MVRNSRRFAVLAVVIVLVGCLDLGACIECYTCSSKTKDECIKPDKSVIPKKHCDTNELKEMKKHAETIDESFSKLFQLDISHYDSQVPMNCLKQVTKVGNKEYVLRGCQYAASEKLDICVKMKNMGKDTLQTTHCSLCNADGCNSAIPTMVPPLVAVLAGALAQLLGR